MTRADLEAHFEGSRDPDAPEPDWGVELSDVVMRALVDRYLDEHELRAQPAEIAAFVARMEGAAEESTRAIWAIQAAKMRARLEDPATPEAEREELRKSVRHAERYARGEMWPDAEERADMQARAAKAQRRLDGEDLGADERAQLEETIAEASRFAGLTDDQAKSICESMEAESNRTVAAPFIEWWKFNRSLFKRYGGRILFQQGGLEAFDATKQWLEERETAGDFEILDTTLLKGFWNYYTRDQSAFLVEEPEGTEFDVPWWEMPDPDK